ncbi:hypothetical protein INR49_024731 [Caranx melampygus]|nr:hypothetical protein INR49_024731 [Caranx melampygus]
MDVWKISGCYGHTEETEETSWSEHPHTNEAKVKLTNLVSASSTDLLPLRRCQEMQKDPEGISEATRTDCAVLIYSRMCCSVHPLNSPVSHQEDKEVIPRSGRRLKRTATLSPSTYAPEPAMAAKHAAGRPGGPPIIHLSPQNQRPADGRGGGDQAQAWLQQQQELCCLYHQHSTPDILVAECDLPSAGPIVLNMQWNAVVSNALILRVLRPNLNHLI